MGGTNAIDIASEFERENKISMDLSRKVAAKIQEMEAEEQAAEARLDENVAPLHPQPAPEPDDSAEKISQAGSEPDYNDEWTSLPNGFRYTSDGSIERYTVPDKWRWLCSPIEFLALTENTDGKAPGILVRILNDSGCWHQLAFSRSALIGGDDLLRDLADHGLRFNPSGKDASELKRLFMSVVSGKRARCVPHVGWHENTFVLHEEILGQPPDQQIVFQPPHAVENHYRTAGTFDGWKSEVATRALGNSRLEFAMSAAFAGPLLKLAGLDSGGFHLRGLSSSGKSTALWASGSTWGGGGMSGFVRSWRATDNALEGIALAHSDAFLPLDEINQVEPDAASRAAYMLANGQGKNRANKSGALRPNYEWRVIFLSTGEISLATKIAESGKRSTAGQEVRVIDIPADAGKGLGIFETLHGFARPDLFADALKDAAQRHYGHAARAFLAEIVKDVPGIAAEIREFIAEAASKICPEKADGQVRRVARRFALTASAGEMAISFGILPWPAGTACRAAERCFKDWLQSRGGAGQKEENDAVEAVRDFIARHTSRFQPWTGNSITPHNRAGFYRKESDGGRTFYVFTDVFRREICSDRGIDPETAAKVLDERGLLKKSTKGRRTRTERLPGLGNQRVYVITVEECDE